MEDMLGKELESAVTEYLVTKLSTFLCIIDGMIKTRSWKSGKSRKSVHLCGFLNQQNRR